MIYAYGIVLYLVVGFFFIKYAALYVVRVEKLELDGSEPYWLPFLYLLWPVVLVVFLGYLFVRLCRKSPGNPWKWVGQKLTPNEDQL